MFCFSVVCVLRFFKGDEASFECGRDKAEILLKEYQHSVWSEERTEYIRFFYGKDDFQGTAP